MSSFVMDHFAIKRLAEFLTYCFSAPEFGTVDTRKSIANAARHAARHAMAKNEAPYTIPVIWSDRCQITPSMMAIRLYEINEAAYSYNYSRDVEPVDTTMFLNFDYEEFPKLTIDYLGRMLKTLQCYMCQCDVYSGDQHFMVILKAVEFAIMEHLVNECCQSYQNAKWGE